MLPIQTILHPTDFSPRSAYAFPLACALARDYGARLLLVHVREMPPVAPYGEFGAVAPEPAEPRERLEAKLEQMQPPDAAIAVEPFLLDGDPAPEIVRLARQHQCDLIVMGTHGRTGLGRLLMGSVAEQVVRTATCPVLTVKTPHVESAAVLAALDEPALT